MGKISNWWTFPGFKIEEVATGFDLPVNLAFVPQPSTDSRAPLCYVTELYGAIKVVTNDWSVHTYASNLLNYTAEYEIPGSGESGVTGICVEPETGDLFVTMLYRQGSQIMGKVVRTHSDDGLRMSSAETVIDGIPSTTKAHQIQAVTVGPDKMLYVNVADGGESDAAQEMEDYRGKVLRLNLYGAVPADNPVHGSPVYALGFRNPFGATWRKSDGSLYVSINGPDRDDVVAKVKPGSNHGWPMTMRTNALFVWQYTQAPTALAFAQDGIFPQEYEDDLFVALFGNSYLRGRHVKGKKIVKMTLGLEGGVTSYDEFVTYIGEGPASPCGLAFGPGGLYFTDLHGEIESEGTRGIGSVYRVSPIPRHATSQLEGVMLAESDNYELVESYVYFPPESVDWTYFSKGAGTKTHPRMGDAQLWDITVKGRTSRNAAWSYPNPGAGTEHIRGYLSFAYGETDLRTERSG